MSFGSTPFSIEDGAHDFRGALMVLDTGRARLRSDGAQQRARGCRTVADPFGQLSRTVTINIRSERTVTLAVHRFEKAELEVIPE